MRWLVKEGDVIRADQPMVEVMTDKATVEIPSPRAGPRARADVRRGPDLPGGQGPRAHRRVGGASDRPRAPRASRRPTSPAPDPAPTRPAPSPPHRGPGPGRDPRRHGRRRLGRAGAASGGRDPRPAAAPGGATVLATPATRKLARELGVELGARERHRPGRPDHLGGRAPGAGRDPTAAPAPTGQARAQLRAAARRAGRRRAGPLPGPAPAHRRAHGALAPRGRPLHLRRGGGLHPAGGPAGKGQRPPVARPARTSRSSSPTCPSSCAPPSRRCAGSRR